MLKANVRCKVTKEGKIMRVIAEADVKEPLKKKVLNISHDEKFIYNSLDPTNIWKGENYSYK